MYEPVSHTLLNQIFDDLAPKLGEKELRFFYSRLGANFYAIHGLFERLYGNRDDFYHHLRHLVEVLTLNYLERSPRAAQKRSRKRRASPVVFGSKMGWHGLVRRWVCQRLTGSRISPRLLF